MLSPIKNFQYGGCLLRYDHDQWLVAELAPASTDCENKDPAIYAPDFFLSNEACWHTMKAWEIVSTNELQQWLKAQESQALAQPAWQEPSFDSFQAQFKSIQQHIKSGELSKIVPVVFATSKTSVQAPHIAYMLQQISDASDSLYPYALWTQHEGMIGATPELLFQVKDNTLHSMALAGTSSLEHADKLLSDPKERHEHQIVIDDLQTRLQVFGIVQIGETQIKHLPQLAHLYTPIQLTINAAKNIDALVNALHPTPALGGAPKERAWRWLRQHDPQNKRQRFGAPLALSLPNGESLCLVAIRNIQWRNDEIILGSGCGIVEQSQLDKEWQELKTKRNSVKALLGL